MEKQEKQSTSGLAVNKHDPQKPSQNQVKKQLKDEISEFDKEIKKLGDEALLRKKRMKLLHDYNDVKDATQEIIGRLANVKGTTLESLHRSFDLPLNE